MKQQTQINKIEWREVELGKVIKLKGGYAFKSERFVTRGIPIIRISNFNNDNVDLSDVVYYSKEDSENYNEFLLKENDVLIAMSGATTGKIGVTIKKNMPCLLNQRVGKFEIINKNLFSKYLLMFVKSREFQKKVFNIASGCAQPNISGRQIESIKIPLPFLNGNPDLKEQERIVRILEKAEKLKERGKDANDLLDEYLKSVFYEMFSNIKPEPFNKEHFEIIDGDRGVNYPHGNDFSKEGHCLFLNTGNVRKDGFSFNELMFITKEKDEQLRKGKAQVNDLILTTRGTVGNVALYNKEVLYKTIRINSGMVLLRPNLKIILPKYLFYLIQMPIIQNQFKKMNSGTAQPQLPITNLKRIKIILPSMTLQQKFVKVVEHVEGLKENAKKTKQNSEELFNSLMQKAFRGEL